MVPSGGSLQDDQKSWLDETEGAAESGGSIRFQDKDFVICIFFKLASNKAKGPSSLCSLTVTAEDREEYRHSCPT